MFVRPLADVPADPRVLARLRDDMVILARVQHDHVLRVEHVTSLGGQAALVTEGFDGVSLRTVLAHLDRRGARMSPRAAVELLAVLAGTLEAVLPRAAGARLFHPGPAPEDVLVDALGRVRLAGLAVARDGDGPPPTPAGYLPPGEAPGGAALSWSLGALLVELLTGEPPTRAQSAAEAASRAVVAVATRLGPDASHDLARVVEDAFHPSPEARPALGVLARRLRAVALDLRSPGLRTWAPATLPAVLDRDRRSDPPPSSGPDHRRVRPAGTVPLADAPRITSIMAEADLEDRPTTVAPFPAELLKDGALDRFPTVVARVADDAPETDEAPGPPRAAAPPPPVRWTRDEPAGPVAIESALPFGASPDEVPEDDEPRPRRRRPLVLGASLGALAALALALGWTHLGPRAPEPQGAPAEPVPSLEEILGEEAPLDDVPPLASSAAPEAAPAAAPATVPAAAPATVPAAAPAAASAPAGRTPVSTLAGSHPDAPHGPPPAAPDPAPQVRAPPEERPNAAARTAEKPPDREDLIRQLQEARGTPPTEDPPAEAPPVARVSEAASPAEAPEPPAPEAAPAPETFRVEFTSADPSIQELRVSCHQGSGRGTGSAVVPQAGVGPCVVTGRAPGGTLTAHVAVVGPATFTCFEGGARTCR